MSPIPTPEEYEKRACDMVYYKEECSRLRTELAELKAKLPKTVDGVAVGVGDNVYWLFNNCRILFATIDFIDKLGRPSILPDNTEYPLGIRRAIYYTREAAEAAMKKGVRDNARRR